MGCGKKVGPFDCCTVVCGKSQELLPQLPDASVSSVITDPPYGVDAEDWDGSVPYAMLTDFLRIARGPVIWFGAAPRIVEAAHNFLPPPQRILIWAPAMTLGKVAAHGMAYRYHPIYTWRLPKKHDGPVWDILRTNTETGNWWKHSCTKPVELMYALCGIAPAGGTVLDPFAGSGSTVVAAQQRGQHFLGFEMNPEHVETATLRLAKKSRPGIDVWAMLEKWIPEEER